MVLLKLIAREVAANSLLCTEETKEIQVASEEEEAAAAQRDALGQPQDPGQEQAGAEARDVGGEPGEVGRTAQAPAAPLASQEDQDLEGPERDQLVIVDRKEEGQEADEEGG